MCIRDSSAGSYLDWVMPALLAQPEEETEYQMHICGIGDLVVEEAVQQLEGRLTKETLLSWDA